MSDRPSVEFEPHQEGIVIFPPNEPVVVEPVIESGTLTGAKQFRSKVYQFGKFASLHATGTQHEKGEFEPREKAALELTENGFEEKIESNLMERDDLFSLELELDANPGIPTEAHIALSGTDTTLIGEFFITDSDVLAYTYKWRTVNKRREKIVENISRLFVPADPKILSQMHVQIQAIIPPTP